MMVVFSGVVLLLSFLCMRFLSVWYQRKRERRFGCEPPPRYPNLDPLLGTDVIFEIMSRMKDRTALGSVHNYLQQYGNTFEFLRLGKQTILTNEPENIKTILATKFEDFAIAQKRNDVLAVLIGYGIFSSNGKTWKQSRNASRPSFTMSNTSDLDFFEPHIKHLIEAIPTDGSFFDIQDLFFRFTMDTSTEFLLGESCHSLRPTACDPLQAEFPSAFDYSKEKLAQAFHLGCLSHPFLALQLSHAPEICHRYVDELIYKALNRRNRLCKQDKESSPPFVASSKRFVLLDDLVQSTQDLTTIKSSILNLLLAGRDTTASLLSSLFHTMARRKDVWIKLRAEVDGLGGRKPTLEELKNMKYLRYVINEVLRLFPPVPWNSRIANKDVILPVGGGADGRSPLFIRKGTTVAYVVWSLHRRKDIYGEDADHFRPERWENLRLSWQYLPFNGGPRICIGQQFALTEASYTTVRLLQEFKSIQTMDQEPWRENLDITCNVDGGVHITLGR